MKIIITILFFFICHFSSATNYYFKVGGNDGAAGTSDATAWASITKFNSFFSSLSPGDSVLFKRGDTFYGSPTASRSGTTLSRIVIGAYGTGAKPIISGFTTLTGWVNVGGNVWQADALTVKNSVNILTIDGTAHAVGRTPNNTFYYNYQSATSTTLTSTNLTTINYIGAELVFKNNSFSASRVRITAQNNGTVTYNQVGAIDNNIVTIQSPIMTANYGFFLQRFAASLDVQGEWYFDTTANKMKIYSTVNPSAFTIRASYIDTLINLNNRTDITVTDIEVEGAGMYGIYSNVGARVTIKNCTANNNTRGIHAWNTDDIIINENTVNNSFFNGIIASNNQRKRVTVDSNLVTNTGLLMGMGIFPSDYCLKGIVARTDTTRVSNYVNIIGNTVTNTGYSAIQFQGSNVLVRRNFIDTFCFNLDDGGGIYTYVSIGSLSPLNYTNRLVDSNIIINAIGAPEGANGIRDVDGIYNDYQTMNVTIRYNTIANIPGNGIQLNNPNGMIVTDNTVYNCDYAIIINKNQYSEVAGNIIKRNVLYQKTAAQYALFHVNYNLASTPWTITQSLQNIAYMDSNRLSNLRPNSYYYYYSANGSTYTFPPAFNLATWKGSYLHDLASILPPVALNDTNSTFYYNAGSIDTVINFPGESKIDPFGNIYVNRDTIEAWSSKIYIDNGTTSISTTLDGTASFDPDGSITVWLWEKISGPSGGDIATPGASITLINNLLPGVYQYRLTVTDNGGLTGVDFIQVTVNSTINQVPVSAAGIDQTKTLPVNTATLNGTGSTDSDGTISSYLWTKATSSPSSGVITSPNAATTTVSDLIQGVYTFILRVTDNAGAVSVDTMRITVSPAVITPTADGIFAFTIPYTTGTSAGVFYRDSIKIVSLWNDSIITAGSHIAYWNGRDDYGNVISNPDTAYTIKVLHDSVQYTWDGTVGNTSDNQTGETKHRGYYHCMRGMAFGPTYGYFVTGYSEGSPSFAKFAIATPNQKIQILNASTSTADLSFVATDGIKVYWGAVDANMIANSFVFGTNVSNDAYVTFSSGVSYTPKYRSALNVISHVNAGGSLITGLAVQQSGSYLFVSRAGMNQLQVLNKTTGALVQTLTYTKPTSLAVDGSDNLWMITDSVTVSKYTVNAVNGTLTGPTLTLSGLIQSLAVSVSTDGSTVVVCEGKTAQQVKGFNNSTGSLSWTMGTAGGYQADPTVNNNKFYFNEADGRSGTAQYNKLPFVAYQPDGSFWVGDPGNFRVQKYNSSRVWTNRIMNLGATYSSYVDPNNINRVFSYNLEFEIDYSQPLTGTTGWSLKRNWLFIYRHPTTLSNGRTYAQGNQIFELPASSQARATGVTITGNKILCSDGSIQEYTVFGGVATIKRFPLTGFTAAGNPIWAAVGEILGVGTINYTQGNPPTSNPPLQQVFHSTNKIAWFNFNLYSNLSGLVLHKGYHLGVMPWGATNFWLAQTEKATHRSYQGLYPGAGWFDIGNLVNNNAGSAVNIIDRNIVTGYNGEFWKNYQTNKYNHYYDNGLAIGQFGKTRVDDVGVNNHAFAEMAGNARTPQMVKHANGDLYLYHSDESDHSAVHRWKISGLNTIAVQSITIPFPSAYTPPVLTYTDLMAGLPFDVALPNNTAGWTRNPTINTGGGAGNWQVNTQIYTYDSLKTNDLYMRFTQTTAQTYNVSRDLGSNNVSNDWRVSGKVMYVGVLNGTANNAYIEVLDNAGKLLTTMSTLTGPNRVVGNGVAVNTVALNAINSFSIDAVAGGGGAGVITFTFNGVTSANTVISDGSADWHRPTTLRFRFNSVTGLTSNMVAIDIKDLKLYKDIL